MKLQFINWFPEWKGFFFKKPNGELEKIYKWYLGLGFFVIRKWR